MNEYKIVDEFYVQNENIGWRALAIVLDRAPSWGEKHGIIIVDGVEYAYDIVFDAERCYTIKDFEGSLLGKTVRFKQ